ncbi:glycosyltransferase family 4 protein [Planctomycetota bacterium]
MRILHITGNMRLGGAQMVVKYLVENADPDRVETFVYPLRPRPVDITIDGEVIEIPYRNYDPRKFWAILRLCRDFQIDIIHAHLHKPIIAALLAGFFRDVRVVVHEHGPIFRRGVQYGLYRWLLRLLKGRADAVIAVSQATADRLVQKARIDRDRITVIYNAVDIDAFAPTRAARDQVRKQWGISDDDIVLGFVGRLDYVKGTDLLIEALELLLQRSKRYFLVMVGEGPQRQGLERLMERWGIAERVKFAGFCEKVSETIQAFDIGVVPSREEALGIAALEMMRMRVPLVCSGVEGLAEIVTHEETALVPDENDPPEIARCVERLVNDKELHNKLADAAYQFTERFGINEYVRAVEQVYREVLGGRE